MMYQRTYIRPNTTPLPYSDLSPIKTTQVYDTFWYFAAERQNIFFRRIEGKKPPWTDDPILQTYKFTNAYRASDRVSQYLIGNVIPEGVQSTDEVFFRLILFKLFNKIETWEALKRVLGDITYRSYNFEQYDQILTSVQEVTPIFSGAYIMPSGKSSFGYSKKHRNCLKLIEMLMGDDVPSSLSNSQSMRQAFELLRSYPMLGDFLAYQYIIDLNYSNIVDFSESEFVVPGPGSKNGIQKVFADSGGLSDIDLIKLVTDRQEIEFADRGIKFKSLWGRRLQYIDCQNLFCEVDKYSRVAHPNIEGRSGRKRIKQKYKQTSRNIRYCYPPKWDLNDLVV